MTNKLFIIEFGSAHWCGCDDHVLVWAETKDEALFKAESYMDNYIRDLITYDPREPDHIDIGEDEFYYTSIYSVEEFSSEEHGEVEWYEVVGNP